MSFRQRACPGAQNPRIHALSLCARRRAHRGRRSQPARSGDLNPVDQPCASITTPLHSGRSENQKENTPMDIDPDPDPDPDPESPVAPQPPDPMMTGCGLVDLVLAAKNGDGARGMRWSAATHRWLTRSPDDTVCPAATRKT